MKTAVSSIKRTFIFKTLNIWFNLQEESNMSEAAGQRDAAQRDISNDAALENMHNTPEEVSNKARGHKANLSNPSMSCQHAS